MGVFSKLFQKKIVSTRIKASERLKLKQDVMKQYFSLSEEDGDLLVPESVHKCKLKTDNADTGVLYSDEGGDPIWFTIGKTSTELIPTIYTLWKKPILPTLTTRDTVMSELVTNNQDLLIKDVLWKPNGLEKNDLVCIASCNSANKVSSPLAVGRMQAVGAVSATSAAVVIIHMHEDNLWKVGSGRKPPNNDSQDQDLKDPVQAATVAPQKGRIPLQILEPEAVTSFLRAATFQAIQTQLSVLPLGSFPIPTSLFYSQYILPSLPLEASFFGNVDIKNSTYKNLTAFLKALSKDNLLELKMIQGDLNVFSINPAHPEILKHQPYRSVGSEKENTGKNQPEEMEVEVEANTQATRNEKRFRELYKPTGPTIMLFQMAKKSTSEHYTRRAVSAVMDQYIERYSLTNRRNPRYINVNAVLSRCIPARSAYIEKGRLLDNICRNMEACVEILSDGKRISVLRRKDIVGQIITQCRKVRCLIIENFTPFGITAEFLCNNLGVTLEVSMDHKNSILVSGEGHRQAVIKLLTSQGVPRKWLLQQGGTNSASATRTRRIWRRLRVETGPDTEEIVEE